jgi:hypothetical protein
MHPVRLSPSAGLLPWLDHAPAGLADFTWSVSKVIFTGGPVVLVEVDVRKPRALPGGRRNSHVYSRQRSLKAATQLMGTVCRVRQGKPKHDVYGI